MTDGPAAPAGAPASKIGEQLWRSLPEVYRARDGGDLAALLEVFGGLLDRVRATLDQRLADSFPGEPAAGEDPAPNQAWLLPYFARLVDVQLRSPHAAGRRFEVANAIDWRKRKGTLGLVQDIAEAIVGPSEAGDAGREVAVQEGFARVALTARIGMPILPPAVFGEPDPPASALSSPATAAQLPGLPAAFLDVRQISRAVQCAPDHPRARRLRFAGPTPISWRQLNPRGAPCFPDSFEDCSLRTVDIRTGGEGRGQSEPRRVLLFAAPGLGLFDPRLAVNVAPVRADVGLSDDASLSGERIGVLTVDGGTLRLSGCRVDTLVLHPGARAELASSAVGAVTATAASPASAGAPAAEPVVSATDSLLGGITADGLVRLVYCTVLGTCVAGRLQASDAIFAGEVALPATAAGCVRYSRVPAGLPAATAHHANTTDPPVFLELSAGASGEPAPAVPAWGQPGCGVLDVATPGSIRFGAEDSGEMGAYHAYAHGLEESAVVEKTGDHLPLGVAPALISDERLLHIPPAIATRA